MPRAIRPNEAGAFYHVMNRGNNRKNVFEDESVCRRFLRLLEESAKWHSIDVIAFCLMTNHYHLCIRTTEANLSDFMKQLTQKFTRQTNLAQGTDGHLFRGRFRSILIENAPYLLEVVRYIHLNPVRAGIVCRPEQFAWSSHRDYLSSHKIWEWIRPENVLEMLGNDPARAIENFKAYVGRDFSTSVDLIYSARKFPSRLSLHSSLTPWCQT